MGVIQCFRVVVTLPNASGFMRQLRGLNSRFDMLGVRV